MTQEEKARAYEMALEKIRAIIYDKIIFSARIEDAKLAEKLEEIFPELKESEDEKMSRELIAYFKNNSVYIKWSGLDVKKVIEWLEKQGEQILANSAKTCKDGVKASELLAEYEKEHPKKVRRKAVKKSNTYERGC